MFTNHSLTLNILTVTLETIDTHSHHGIPVTVRGTAQVKIGNTKESLRKSCELFLGMMESDLISFFQNLMEGHQRDVIGKMDVEDIYYRRDVFCEKLLENCSSKLQEMGLVLISYNVNQVEDTSGCIEDHLSQIVANNAKNVRIQEAESRRDSIIETILTESEMKLRKASLELEMQEKERNLMVQKLNNEVEVSKLEAVKEMTSLLEEVKNVGKVAMSNLDEVEMRSELLLKQEEINLEKERSRLVRQKMELDSHEEAMERMTRAHLKVIKDCSETEAQVIQTAARTHSQLLRLASSTEHDLMMMTHLESVGRGDNLHGHYQITNTSSSINTNDAEHFFSTEPLNKEHFISDVQPNLTQATSAQETMVCLRMSRN